jgi:hypothetical protein
MTTDEEEIERYIKIALYGAGCTKTYCEEITKEFMKIIDKKSKEVREKGKKEGIQIERKRIKKQINKDSIEVKMPDDLGWVFAIGIEDIDVYKDVE